MRTHRLRLRVAALVLPGVLLLGACTTGTDTAAAGQSPQSGGTFTYAISYDSQSLDPQRNISKGGPPVLRLLVDSLTDQDAETGDLKPWLAEEWKANDTLTEFSFTLHPGVTFSDGSKLDAEAVKANFDTIVKLDANYTLAQGYLEGYRETKVTGPLTFTVVFEKPTAQFLQGTSTISLGLISPKSTKLSPDRRRSKGVSGTGPFVLDEYTRGKEIDLTKREGYNWPSSLAKHKGEAYVDKIAFPVVSESGVRAGLLTSGQADGIDDVQAQDQAQFDGNGFHLASAVGPGIAYNLTPNETRPFLRDRNVRLAIQHGIDRATIVKSVLQGVAKTPSSILSSTTPGWADTSDKIAYDPARSRKLLDQAGWKAGKDGIRRKDGKKLTLELPYFQDETDRLALVQQQLKDIGIDLHLEHVDDATIDQRYADGDYDLCYVNWTRADGDILRFYLSKEQQNMTRTVDGELQKLLDAQAAQPDADQRDALLKQAQERVADQGHAYPLWEIVQTKAFSDQVHDVVFDSAARVKFYDTWINQ